MDGKRYIADLEKYGRQEYKKYVAFRVNVPVGKSGPWTIDHFETDVGLAYLRLARDGRPPGIGKFTTLRYNGAIIMSDTVPEIEDLLPYLYHLRGRVLISGLGLGMIVQALTKNRCFSENVKTVTVVEKDRHVLKLSAPHYRQDERVTIVHSDIHSWVPAKGQKFDSAWHDIWDSICGDNLDEMKQLRRYFSKFVPSSKQFCWGEAVIRSGRL